MYIQTRPAPRPEFKPLLMKHQPNYYAVIPASVRYDSTIPAGAKLLYGEITALSNQKGYCFASNGYFADLYACTAQAISKWIKQLERAGHVRIEYVGVAGQQERRVSITVEGYQPQLRGVSTHVEGVSTTVEHNNTRYNITSKNKREGETSFPDAHPHPAGDEFSFETEPQKEKVAPKRKSFAPPTLQEAQYYFASKGAPAEWAAQFWNYYEANGWKVGRNPMKKWEAAASGWISRQPQYQTHQHQSNGKAPRAERNPHLVTEDTLRKVYADLQAEGLIPR